VKRCDNHHATRTRKTISTSSSRIRLPTTTHVSVSASVPTEIGAADIESSFVGVDQD